MQEQFSVVLNGPGSTDKKREIAEVAKEQGMSRSAFMLWLYERYQEQYRPRANRRKQ